MSPVKQTRGLEALLCACGELRPDRVAALLPSIEPDVCYDVSYGSATEYVHRFQKLVELLVLMSSNNTLPGFKDASEDDRVKIVRIIATKQGLDFGGRWNNRTAPQLAAAAGHAKILKVLLDAGASTVGLFERMASLDKKSPAYVRVLEVIARRASQDPDDVVICMGEQTPEERTAAARARAEREGTVVDVDDESAPKRARGQ